jgi:hypothetical protein
MRPQAQWSFGSEDAWDAYAVDDATAAAEFEQECLLREAEELRQLNEEPEADEDSYARDAAFWCRVLRHLPVVPNPDHRKAVEAWKLRDIYTSASLAHGGCLGGETLRGTSLALHAAGIMVRDKLGVPVPRPKSTNLPEGAFYPQQCEDYVVRGVGFCIATELWLSSTEVREVGWDALLSRCENWFRLELRSKKPFSKRSPK